MKWGDKFSPDFVNRLYSMVDRSLHRPFRFVCLTDDPKGLNDSIETFAIPDMAINTQGPERGWKKISTFTSPLYDLKGKTLFLDLDVVIVGDLAPFFEQPDGFYIIRDFVRKDGTGNSSVYLFEANQYADILDNFRNDFMNIRKRHRNEQEYLSHYLIEKGLLNYWPSAWCPSFKKNCVHKGLAQLYKTPSLPDGARIVIFHGHPNPDDAIQGISGKWYRKVLPTPWIEEYWK
jgi:hypothetical protein